MPPREHKDGKKGTEKRKEQKEETFLSVGGELQTDTTFDREIIDRMGKELYYGVFHPAIEARTTDTVT